jgi:hypothetical protein
MSRIIRNLMLVVILISSLGLAGWSIRIFAEPRLPGITGVLGEPMFICPPSFEESIRNDAGVRRIWSGGFTAIGACLAFASARSLLRRRVQS